MSEKLQHLFELHCLTSWDKQHRLASLVGDRDGQLNADAGTITFEFRYVFPVQALGAESAADRTWLWAWADNESELPPSLLETVNRLWEYGERYDIEELVAASFPLDGLTGDYLALVAAGISRASCYYRRSVGDRAEYLLITAKMVDKQPPWRGAELVEAFRGLAGRFAFNHKTALLSYCVGRNLPVQETATGFVIQMPEGEVVRVQLDEAGRVDQIAAG